MRTSRRENNAIIQKFERDVPADLLDIIKKFVQEPAEEAWYQMVRWFIGKMESERAVFDSEDPSDPVAKDGRTLVSVGIACEGYGRADQVMTKVKIGDDTYEVCIDREFAGREVELEKDLILIEEHKLSFYVDLPSSMIWGDLPFHKVISILSGSVAQYNNTFSFEKVLGRQIEPQIKRLVEKFTKDVEASEAKIRGAHELIREEIGSLRDKLARKKAMEDGTSVPTMLTELKKLASTGVYRNMRCTDAGFFVTMTNIKIEWDGYVYEMGDYEVTIGLADAKGAVTIARSAGPHYEGRRAKTLSDTSHPNVRGGNPCLGNYQDYITDLIIDRNIPEALIHLRRFLVSYGSERPFVDIEEWLPDEYYEAFQQGRKPWLDKPRPSVDARPNATEAGYDPGPNPTADLYEVCKSFSLEQIGRVGGQLRCLAKPFGAVCDRCPVHAESLDAVYGRCKEQSPVENCMHCGDMNCPHYQDQEDGCFTTQVEAAAGEVLACAACPFGNRMCGHYGQSRAESNERS